MTERPEEIWVAKARELLDRIPGYEGYRLKEARRDADRRVRAAVADTYAAELARVETIGRDLANQRRLGEIATVERASQTIRHFIDRVRSITPGYGGIFGDRDIDGIALDQLRLFDEGLMLGVDELKPAVDRLEAAAAAGEPLEPAASAIAAAVEREILRLKTRQDVIETGKAVSGESALAALRPLSEITPAAVFFAQPGDAISILGDDFLVDSKIAIEGRPKSFVVLRIQRDPEEWLMVSREPGDPILRMQTAEPSERGLSIAGHAMRQSAAGTGDGRITGARGSNGLHAVRYALLEDIEDPESIGLVVDWDGERQAFLGKPTEPLDIEVFRRTDAG